MESVDHGSAFAICPRLGLLDATTISRCDPSTLEIGRETRLHQEQELLEATVTLRSGQCLCLESGLAQKARDANDRK
jgi:hypothetical protein